MSRRPGVRKSDLNAALTAALALGLRPRATRFHSDGSFTLDFEDTPAPVNDDVEAALQAFEAKHGQG